MAAIAIVLQPLASLAAPAPSSGIAVSGDPSRPTLSWSAVPDEPVSGDEWIKRDGRPAGGAIAPWEARTGQATLVFNGKMWIMGGSNSNGALNDVWSSSDGVNWTEATASADWAARANHSATVFNGKMWVMGGDTSAGGVLLRGDAGSGVANDVWSSSDGINWTQATDTAAWSARESSALQVFNGKMWLLGGSVDSGTHLRDVWRSDDGATWTLVTDTAPWGNLLGPASIIYDGKMWIMGGGLSDVWYTADGTNWNRAATGVEWGGRIDNSLALIDGKMWITGGSYSRDAWTSSDGATWTKVVTGAEWVTSSVNMAVTYNNKLWLIGAAYSGYSPVFRQVWQSSDGVNWSTPENIQAGSNRMTYSLRNLEAVAYDDKLWVIGNNASGSPEVWVSSDGASWSQASDSVNLPMRWDYNITVFQDKMWLVGGSDADYNYTSEVWYSTDGITWTQATANAPWPGRAFGHGVIVFNDRLWVIGGESDTTSSYLLSDVWSSGDGMSWRQETDSAAWGLRGYGASVVFDNKMWLMGGSYGDNWDDMNDAWYSTDGVNWTQAAASTAWSPRNSSIGLSVFTFDNELWMIGDNDIWKSSDGVVWTEIDQTMLWGNRADYATAAFDGRLWAIGGAANGFLTNEVWSTPNRAVSYYELCWDQVQGGCSYKTQVSASRPLATGVRSESSWLAQVGGLLAPTTAASGGQLSYTLTQTLLPGTWYFSVAAVNYENEETVLGDKTIQVAMTDTPVTPDSGTGGIVTEDSTDIPTPDDSEPAGSDNTGAVVSEDNRSVKTEEGAGKSGDIAFVWIGLGALLSVGLLVTIYRNIRSK